MQVLCGCTATPATARARSGNGGRRRRVEYARVGDGDTLWAVWGGDLEGDGLADTVGRFLVAVTGEETSGLSVRFLEINGGFAMLALRDREPDTVLQLDVADGVVQAVYLVRNPDKLRSLAAR
ncbi:hypothetical protein ACWEKM_12100 [Streptomyces sp. NPDC004752]